ncbi:6-bladed beta-propeller, partial [Candidatus Saccharibacteria bacterium]|nr:6-bladed beta-propeller [Candidatus Saccharibacteria bacterium]
QWGEAGSDPGQFYYPKGVALDSSDNVYVTDSNNSRIQKFDSNGVFIAEWGSNGTDDGQFSNPTGITIDSQNNVYIADYDNDRVQKFDSNGNFITSWGSSGSNNGQFSAPWAIAVDSQDNVYVTDDTLNRVLKFDSDGTYLSYWGSTGSGDNQFSYPRAITIDGQDNVYVSDSGNNRIVLFDANGEYVEQWGSELGQAEFGDPRGITIDANNRVIVTERGNQYANNIQILTTDGEFTDMFGRAGESASDINFHAEGSQDIQNTYYDKTSSQASKCGFVYDVLFAVSTNPNDTAVQPSIETSTEPISNCTPKNPTGSEPNYFINNRSNAPLDEWDFDTIWKTETTSYPTFIGSTLPAVDEPDPDPTPTPTPTPTPSPTPSPTDPGNPTPDTDPTTPPSSTSDSTSKDTPNGSDSGTGSGEGTPVQPFEKVGNSTADLEPRVGFLQGIWTVKQLSSFNWLLVILLFILSLIYAYRAYRERAQRVALQAAVHRYNSLKTSMTNFINVIVHYLGTPLSIMKGATEMMTVASGAPHWAQSMLGHKLADFNKTTSVLGDKAQEINSSIQPPVASNIPISKSIKNPYIWLPLSVTVSIWLLITLLIGFSSSLTQSRVIIGLQALILVLVIVIIIFIDHYHELQKEIVNQYRQNMKLEETSISSRREYLETLSGSLNDDLESLKIASKNLPVIKPVKLFRNGLAMLGDMVKEVDKVKRFSTLSSDAPIQNLSTELDKLKPDIKKLASEKQITLNIDSDSEVRSAIQPEESNQLLMSIISNAIMFSKSEGTVSVVAKSGRKNNTITIQDHGEGIPADVLEHIYEPFTKGSNTEQYNHKGLGLNLHSNKVIVDKIGGSIDISSSTETVDSGTKVTLSLPAVPKDPKNIAPQLVTPSK